MRMCNVRALAALATLMILVSFAVGADDAPPFASATEAYHQGMAALKSGRIEMALPALQYAAERGVLGAQLKLARIYAAGNGVKQDDAQAFFFYRQIANEHADITPLSPVAKYVAEAFVALGQYYLEGIPGTLVLQDPARGADLFRHAASYFGDADAQYALAGLYLTGTGVEKNMGLAVNWLATAAKKQHAEAQAKLGELLWRGGDEIRQKPAKGLALIMLAHANAKANGKEPKWIEDLYVEAQGAADAAMLKEAQSLMPEFGGPALDTVRWRPRPGFRTSCSFRRRAISRPIALRARLPRLTLCPQARARAPPIRRLRWVCLWASGQRVRTQPRSSLRTCSNRS